MRKFLLLFYSIIFISINSWGQAGFFGGTEGGVIALNHNGSSQNYRTDVGNLGTVATTSLFFNGGFIHTFKNGSGNVCGGTILYRIYNQGDTPSSFVSYNLPFSSNASFTTTTSTGDINGSTSGDQRWGDNITNVNLLTGLASGTCILEFYFEGDINPSGGCGGNVGYGSSGSPFQITFEIPFTSQADGDWNNTSTWLGGKIPTSNSYVNVNHDINITNSLASTPPTLINISSSKTLTLSSTPNTLTTNIINNGTLIFAASSTASLSVITNNTGGIINLENTAAINFFTLLNNTGSTLTVKDGGNLGIISTTTNQGTINISENIGESGYFGFSGDLANTGTINVFGTLARAAQSSVTIPNYSGIAPIYNTGSILGYAQFEGANLTVTGEWTTGTGSMIGVGQPDNVALATASGTGGTWTLNLPAYDVGVAGEFIIGSGTFVPATATADIPTLTQNNTSGNDLYLRGNMTNNGTFNGNSRATFFQGTGAKTISGTGTSNFAYFFVNEGSVEYQKNINIANDLTIDAMTSLISEPTNGRVLSMSGGTFINNGTFTANDGTVSFTGSTREVQGSSTTSFYNVEANGGVDFVNTNIANITNIFTINSGGFVDTGSAPNYASGSTLNYASGGSYSVNESWYENTLSGAGVPVNVSITNNTDVNFSNNGFFRKMSGNLDIEAGSSFSLSTSSGGDLEIGGNLTNNGTFNANSRRITFNGTTNQNFTGVSNADYITVNKPSGDVVLNNAIDIDNEVIMTAGTFDLNGNNMTLIGTSSSIQEDATNDYLIIDKTAVDETNTGGAIIVTGRSGSADVAGLGISIIGDVTLSNISRYHYKADGGKAGPRIFNVTGSVNTGTANLSILSYGSATPLSPKQWKWDSTNGWTENNGVSITGFSSWTLASGNVSLPIELLSFTGTQVNERQAILNWQTASEKNNVGFEVQASKNAKDFQKIAFVEGSGNSSQIMNYELSITNLQSTYFRLKQIDKNGVFSLSDIIFIEVDRQEKITIYPNPTSGDINIQGIAENENVIVGLYNVQGTNILNIEGQIGSILPKLKEKLRSLATGQYILKLRKEELIFQQKIIKID